MRSTWNDLNRDVDVILYSGATLTAGSDFSSSGDLTVKAETGTNDYIKSETSGTSIGLAGLGDAASFVKVVSNTDVTIQKGVTLLDRLGAVNVRALTGTNAYSSGRFNGGGVVAFPEASANDDDSESYTLNAHVYLGTAGSGENASITGKNVNIYAGVNKLYVSAYAYALTVGAYSKAWAYSYIRLNIGVGVTASAATLSASNNLNVQSSAAPIVGGTNVYVYAGTKIIALFGKITSDAYVYGATNSQVAFDSNTRLCGSNIAIDATKFNNNVSLTATGTRYAFAKKSTNKDNDLNNGAYVNASAATYVVGGSSAGIFVGVDKNGNVHSSGTTVSSRDNMNWTPATLNGDTYYGGAAKLLTVSAPGGITTYQIYGSDGSVAYAVNGNGELTDYSANSGSGTSVNLITSGSMTVGTSTMQTQ